MQRRRATPAIHLLDASPRPDLSHLYFDWSFFAPPLNDIHRSGPLHSGSHWKVPSRNVRLVRLLTSCTRVGASSAGRAGGGACVQTWQRLSARSDSPTHTTPNICPSSSESSPRSCSCPHAEAHPSEPHCPLLRTEAIHVRSPNASAPTCQLSPSGAGHDTHHSRCRRSRGRRAGMRKKQWHLVWQRARACQGHVFCQLTISAALLCPTSCNNVINLISCARPRHTPSRPGQTCRAGVGPWAAGRAG